MMVRNPNFTIYKLSASSNMQVGVETLSFY